MSNIKRVVSMLAAKDKLTLFTEEGGMTVLTADGDYDVAKISEFLTPKLTGTSVVEIDLEPFSTIGQALQNLPMEVEDEGIVVVQVINGKEVQGIFYPQKISVAVAVGNDTVEIPHVENLTEHMKRAVKEKSPSVANFFKRIAPVIQSRGHSAEDLMQFIKRSEMPLTNDGCIIAYKRVNEAPGEPGYYVDVHSGKIKQRVGSRVTMPVDMVDKSRHNSCSTGLHVANLGYLGGFSGAKTLVVLVKPENFIAVPHGEDTKARVSSYDIIGVISNGAHRTVNAGNPVDGDTSFENLIKAAVEGRVMEPFEEIHVGQKEITKVVPLKPQPKAKAKSSATASGKSLLADKAESAPVNVVAKTRETKEKVGGLTMPEEVKAAFQKLREGLSKTKVAEMFNTSTRSIGRWIEKYGDPMATKEALPNEAEEISQEDLEAIAEAAPQIIANLAQTDGGNTLEAQAKRFFMAGDFAGLKAFKKAKKKSWVALGFTLDEIGQIEAAA